MCSFNFKSAAKYEVHVLVLGVETMGERGEGGIKWGRGCLDLGFGVFTEIYL